MLGAPPPIFRKRPPYDTAGGKQMIVTVEPRYVDAILTQSDKYHMFARPTWRDGEPKNTMEVLWLRRSVATIAQDIRTARDKVTRYAGPDFRGITLRGAGYRL